MNELDPFWNLGSYMTANPSAAKPLTVDSLKVMVEKLRAEAPEPVWILFAPDGTVTTGPDPLKLACRANPPKTTGLIDFKTMR